MAQHFSIKNFTEIQSKKDLKQAILNEFADDVDFCIAIYAAWELARKKRIFTLAEEESLKWQTTFEDHQVMLLPQDHNVSALCDEYTFTVRPSKTLMEKVSKRFGKPTEHLYYGLEFNVVIPYTRSRCEILDVSVVA